MKKLGTPIGAGPGSASEKVGLAGVGVPSGWRGVDPARSLAFFAMSSCAFFTASTGAGGLCSLPVVSCLACLPAVGSCVGVLGEVVGLGGCWPLVGWVLGWAVGAGGVGCCCGVMSWTETIGV